ncbi:MAG: tripartite tricarboxylate transporter substrate binding protein [Acetobacteraceae bacterium]|nr:tripartite tricarboxylate transporter substrate binding protein [Acetobacteraceae bacterium]
MHSLTRRAALAALATPALASAQGGAYPNRPVRIVVPFPPGNMSDLIARVLAEEMQTRHGVQVVVDNRAGATGALGIQAVTRAEPDGYTLLLSSNSPLSVNPAVTPNLPFDVLRDLVPMSLIGWTSFLMVFPPDFPARTLGEAVALMRANPRNFIAANPGMGTAGHLMTELFGRTIGVPLEQVPYRGSAQALMDLSQNRVQVMIDALTSSMPQVQGGRVRPLAIMQQRRSPLAPEVPAMPEAGVPEVSGFDMVAWAGLLGPAGTPAGVTAYWNEVFNALLRDQAFVRRLAQQNVEGAPPGPPARLTELLTQELDRWTRLVRDANIRVT